LTTGNGTLEIFNIVQETWAKSFLWHRNIYFRNLEHFQETWAKLFLWHRNIYFRNLEHCLRNLGKIISLAS